MKLKVLISNLQNEKRPDSKIVEFEKSYCVIGRKKADLILDEPRCSKQHAVLYQGFDDSLRIRDMGSTNGTFVGGVKVIDAKLEPGSEIRIGKYFLSVIEFEGTQRTGRRAFEEIGVRSGPKGTSSSVTAVDQQSLSDRRVVSGVRSPDKKPACFGVPATVYFIDEEGTESKVDFEELVRRLNTPPARNARKSQGSPRR